MITTVVKYRLAVIVLVLNDQRYGAIKWLQEKIYGRWGEVDLANPDFPVLARAFGAQGQRVETLDELPGALGRALREAGPTLIELPLAIDPPWEF